MKRKITAGDRIHELERRALLWSRMLPENAKREPAIVLSEPDASFARELVRKCNAEIRVLAQVDPATVIDI